LIQSGNGEWENSAHCVLRILLQSPEQLASDIYRWASTKEILGTVYTLFELHSGDEYQDSGVSVVGFVHPDTFFHSYCFPYHLVPLYIWMMTGFHGCDPLLLRRSLEYLQSVHKVSLSLL
jgi:hypothetical protein